MLICSQFVDIYYFITHLYYYNANTISSDYMPTLTPEAFNTLEAVVQREIRYVKLVSQQAKWISSQKLIKTLREELEISTCIQSLIFGKFVSLKEAEEQEKNAKLQ